MAFGSAETAKLLVDLSLTGNFQSQLGKVNQSLSKTAANIDRTQSRAYRAGQQIGTGIKRGAVIAAAGVGILASQVAFGIQSLIDLENQTAQTNAVLKSTKGAAGQTADSIRALAEKYESLNATIDDKVIQSAENVLLTFTNIRSNAFEPTLQAALDLSQALHQDLQTSIIQVGKAVNDPATGFGALKRAGVSFSQAQIDLLKSSANLNKEEQKHFLQLRKSNKAAAERYKQGQLTKHQMDAQRVVLAELNKEFGGSFLAGGNTTAGKIAKFNDAIEGLQQSLARALLPTIGNVADALTEFLNDPGVIAAADKLGEDIGRLFSKQNITNGVNFIKSFLPAIKTAITVVGKIAETALAAWNKLPAPLQKLLVTGFVVNKLTGGLVTNTGGGIIDSLTKGAAQGAAGGVAGTVVRQVLTRGGSPANPLFTSDVSAGLGRGGGGFGLLGKLFGIGTAVAGGLAIASIWKSMVQDPAFDTQVGHITDSAVSQLTSGRSLAELQTGRAGVAQGLSDLTVKGGPLAGPLNSLVDLLYGGQKEKLKNLLKAYDQAINALNSRGSFPVGPGRGPMGNRGERGASQDAQERARGAKADALAAAELKKHPRPVQTPDIEGLRTRLSQGLRDTQADVEKVRGQIAGGLQPKVDSVVSAARATTAAIEAKDFSLDAKFNFDINVSAAGVSKGVTIQRRYGPGNGSAGRDLGGLGNGSMVHD